MKATMIMIVYKIKTDHILRSLVTEKLFVEFWGEQLS